MRQVYIHTAFVSVAAIALTLPGQAAAQQGGRQSATGADQTEIERLRQELGTLQSREGVYQLRLEQLEARLAAVEHDSASRMDPISAVEAASMRGAYISPQKLAVPDDVSLAFFRRQDIQRESAQLAQTDPLAAPEASDRRSPAPTEAVVAVAEEQQGRFGSRFGLDLGVGYSHFDNARISLNGFLALDSIFLGRISIDQSRSDIFTLDPTLRFGFSDRLFVDANLPVLYRSSNFLSGGAGGSASALVEKTVRDQGIGDLNLGASYRLAAESESRPDMVINARVKFPTGRHPFGVEFVEVVNSQGNLEVPTSLATGSGVYGASLGVSMLKTLDPMVVFGNVTYFRNFSKHFDDIDEGQGDIPGRVAIGNAWQFGAGLAFALNEKSSISMSYSQRLVERTRLRPDGQDERLVVGSQANVGIVNLGATFSLGDRLALVTNVGIGLTDDSPDMSASIRIPYRF